MSIPTPQPPIALAQLPNMTLYFRQSTGEFIEDPLTGNETAESVEVPVLATVRAIKDASRTDLPGVDVSSIPMRGFIVDFGEFQGELPLSDRVRALLLTNPETGGSEEGWFSFQETVTPFISAVKQVAGVPITGLFSVTGDGKA
ncbi:MAG: hypothetical protein AAFY20_09360 [Cyanobacteria bacterium J06639_14]